MNASTWTCCTCAMICWLPLVLQLCLIEANTHWIVSEGGRIQAQDDSVFNLQRPYDLMAFIRQERRVLELSVIQRQLRLYDDNNNGAGLHLHSAIKEAELDPSSESEESGLIAVSDYQEEEPSEPSDSQKVEHDHRGILFPLSSDFQDALLRHPSDLQGLQLSPDKMAVDAKSTEYSVATAKLDDCRNAKSLDEFDFYQSTVFLPKKKNISRRDFLEFSLGPMDSSALNEAPPKCTESVSLNFSMHAFEHLSGMQSRDSLTMTSELDLLEEVLEEDSSVDEFGAMVNTCFKKNPLSWLLYNYAAIYWRMKGEAFEAIECLRRSLHLSPSRFVKTSALLNLANVLHRCRQSTDAVVVLRVALDTAAEPDIILFTLGNVHAALGEYTEAESYYERLLRVEEKHTEARSRMKAIQCHLEADSRRRFEEAIRLEREKEVAWTKVREKVMSQLVKEEEKVAQHQYYASFKARLTEDDNPTAEGEPCRMEQRNGRRVIQCSLPEHQRPLVAGDSDFTIRSRKEEVTPPLIVNENPISFHIPVRPPLYRKRAQDLSAEFDPEPDLPYLETDWPTKAECDLNVVKFPAWNEFSTTYLSPENKGFEVRALLGVAQGLGIGSHHPFPWYPPICTSHPPIPSGVRSGDHIDSVRYRSRLPTAKLPDQSLKMVLLSHVEGVERPPADDSSGTLNSDEPVGQVTQDEIGQRILTALKQNLGPSWILYNLAALYWRVEGNVFHSLECVRHSLYYVPDQYRDVPLLSLANILYRVGRVDDAVTVMQEALAINDVEPVLFFFMGNLMSAVGNGSGAVYYYLEALAQDPSNEGMVWALRVVQCYQKFHQLSRSLAPVRKHNEGTSGHSEVSSVSSGGSNVQGYTAACAVPSYWSYERRHFSSCVGVDGWVMRDYLDDDAGVAEVGDDCASYYSDEEGHYHDYYPRRP